MRPVEWVIVDDGSTDGTPALAERLASEHDWVAAISLSPAAVTAGPLADGRRTARDVTAFRAGVSSLRSASDVVVKVDADISFAPDYFERLLGEFAHDASLGIAGGLCLEERGGAWHPVHATGNHVRGAARAYRWSCLEELMPLEERLGWDAIDAEEAALRGWSSRTIPTLTFRHHRPVGARDRSRARAWADQGSLAHHLGYRPSYLVVRALFKATRDPAAVALLGGYVRAAVRREPRYRNPAVRASIRRRQLLRNLPRRAQEALGRRAPTPAREG